MASSCGKCFALLLVWYMAVNICSAAVSETQCNPGSSDATSGGAAVCAAVDANAECKTDATKCSCEDGYKEGSQDSNTCVLLSVSETTCDPGENAKNGGISAACTAVDANAECKTGATKCSCKAGYKEGPPDSHTCVLKFVSETACDPTNDAQTSASAVCKAVDTNAECPDGTTKCACKAGYKQDATNGNTCVAVLTGSCSTNAGCTGEVPNSECSSNTCSCVAGFKTENNLCTKVLEGTCNSDGDCTGTILNSECSEQKCQCTVDYIADRHICKKALGKTCSDTNDCVMNAECDTTCKCSSGFLNTAGICAPESSATSPWMTISVIGTCLLVSLVRLI